MQASSSSIDYLSLRNVYVLVRSTCVEKGGWFHLEEGKALVITLVIVRIAGYSGLI